MSKLYQTAEALAAHLGTVVPESELAIVVDRQKDLQAEVNKSIGKVKGGVAVVEWGGVSQIDARASQLRGTSNFVVTVICKPVLRAKAGQLPADDLVEQLADAMHHWHPEPEKPSACRDRMEVTAIQPVNHPQYLIYSIRAEMNLQHKP